MKEKLAKARKSKRFSQEDVAQYLHISQGYYNLKENGKVKIYDDEWNQIAKLLDVPVEDIWEDDEGSTSQNFENVQGNFVGSHIGSNNVYCNIPEFILENQQNYINMLLKEINTLKEKIAELENSLVKQ